jgi:CRP-like cAMP-binding protein
VVIVAVADDQGLPSSSSITQYPITITGDDHGDDHGADHGDGASRGCVLQVWYACPVSTPEELARAAAKLDESPGDLDAWVEVAARLAAVGAKEAANTAFEQLGQSACDIGRVALACACARWLAGRDAQRGKKLVDKIIDVHGAGSKRIDEDVLPPQLPRARSSTRPPSASDVTEDTPDRADAIAAAQKALAAAVANAQGAAIKKVAPSPLVATLGRQPLRAFINAMTVRAVPAGTVVIDVGQPANALYWLARGRAEVTRDDTVLGELVPGGFFGEIALVAGSTRTARVTTLSDAWLIEIPTSAVEEAAAKEPRLAEVLAAHARTRLLANVMRTSELFAALPAEDRSELLGRFEPVLLAAGDTFIRKGEDNEHLWVIVSGRCVVTAADTEIARLGPGAAIGEISLVARKPATADVTTVEQSSLLRLPRREFEVVAAKYPEMLAEVYKLVVSREEANRAIEHDATELVV